MKNRLSPMLLLGFLFASLAPLLLTAQGCAQKKAANDRLRFIQFYDPQ